MLESKKPTQLIKKLQSNDVEVKVNFLDDTTHTFNVKVSKSINLPICTIENMRRIKHFKLNILSVHFRNIVRAPNFYIKYSII